MRQNSITGIAIINDVTGQPSSWTPHVSLRNKCSGDIADLCNICWLLVVRNCWTFCIEVTPITKPLKWTIAIIQLINVDEFDCLYSYYSSSSAMAYRLSRRSGQDYRCVFDRSPFRSRLLDRLCWLTLFMDFCSTSRHIKGQYCHDFECDYIPCGLIIGFIDH